MLSSIFYLKKHKTDIYIAIDPVNALSALIGKRLHWVDRVIFYTADYALKRFSNPILNRFYHFLDKLAINNADCIWNVSSRIREIRKKQKVPDSKNILIPNAPLVKVFKEYRKIIKYKNSFVLMANFTPAINYQLILEVIRDLKKKYKTIKLGFIGAGEMEEQTKKIVREYGLLDNVTFLGFMDHNSAITTAASYEIGVAPYASLHPWTEYGDSLKAREYLALGLAVIISNNVSTGDDIVKYGAGYSIQMDIKHLYKTMDKLLSNKRLLSKMQKNAIKAAKDYDLEKILDTYLYKTYLI
jgi:glycosyltransferase involved in cell wall biosynthesis